MTTKEARKIILAHITALASMPEEIFNAIQTLMDASEDYERTSLQISIKKRGGNGEEIGE